MNETNRCTVNFQFLLMAQIAVHVSGSFSAHHQECYQPYDGLGTFLCSSVTDGIKLYQSRRTADNAPDDGQRNCLKHVELLCP